MAFTVKNTFIDWLHDDTLETVPPRRAQSEPPTLAREASSEAPALERETFIAKGSLGTPRSGKNASASTASSVGSAFDDELDTWACESTDAGSACDHLEDHVPQGPAPVQKTKLKLSAKAYQPVQRQPPPVPSVPVVVVPLTQRMPPQVYHEFESIVNIGRKAFRKHECVGKTVAGDSGFGWSVTGFVRRGTSGSLEEGAFAACKQALLTAAEQSKNVYILGYEAQPFTPSPTRRGFTAQLAFVRDESHVCWDVICTGCCRRAHSCAWQHPQWMVAVHITAVDSP